MTRVLMLVVLVVAVTTTLAETRANRIHVTAQGDRILSCSGYYRQQVILV